MIILRLLRLGLLHKYIYWKVRYGERRARQLLLKNRYEARLHRLLMEIGFQTLVDVGAYPYEKLGYTRYYLGVDMDSECIGGSPDPYTRYICGDINNREVLKEVLNWIINSPKPRILTIDVEGNIDVKTMEKLYPHFDIVIHEIHDKNEYLKAVSTAKKNMLTYKLLDYFPDKTFHLILSKKDLDIPL